MLNKSSRLSREAFESAFKGASRFRGKGFQVLFTPNTTFKASVVVSKKVEKTAVGRNRIRRRFYGYFRDFSKKTHILGHFIVLTSPEVRALTYTELLSSFTEALKIILSRKTHSR